VLLAFVVLWLVGVLPGGREPSDARLAAIEQQLRELAARPAPAPPDPKAFEELTGRLSRLEGAVAAPRPPAGDPALAGRLTTIENAIKPLSDNVAALTRRSDETAAALRETRARAEAATAALSELQTAARAGTAAERGQIDALANRIAALERTDRAVADQLAKRSADAANDRAVRFAVAAGALRATIERGEPFAAELAAVKPLAAEARSLATLEPFAASGLPGSAALSRELSGLLPAMRRLTETAPREGGGFIDRLQANAERLVRIRPVGAAPGDDTAAVLARVEARAAQGDVAGALAELGKLPPSVRAPAQAWIGKAEARAKALEASRKLAADAIAALKPAS
jgi:hypothetical protein